MIRWAFCVQTSFTLLILYKKYNVLFSSAFIQNFVLFKSGKTIFSEQLNNCALLVPSLLLVHMQNVLLHDHSKHKRNS